MAITKLTKPADEQSTYPIIVTVSDETGTPTVPDSFTWSLSDLYGRILNGRNGVVVLSPAMNNTVVLSGLDLAIVAGTTKNATRRFMARGTLTSALGSIPFAAECEFDIPNLVNLN